MLATFGASVAPQVGGPAALADQSGVVIAALSFALVALFGAALLTRREATVDRAIDRAVEGSPLAVVYGLVAFGLIVVVGAYLLTQVARIGVGGLALQWLGALVVGTVLVLVATLGYVVVGTYLTQLEGARRPWLGTVIGAALSAVPWVVLPPAPAVGVWVLLAAVGLGSPARHYIHGDRGLDPSAGR